MLQAPPLVGGVVDYRRENHVAPAGQSVLPRVTTPNSAILYKTSTAKRVILLQHLESRKRKADMTTAYVFPKKHNKLSFFVYFVNFVVKGRSCFLLSVT